MENRTAKSLAAAHGCQLWWCPEFQCWALHPTGSDEVEASGGQWMSAATLRGYARENFIGLCRSTAGLERDDGTRTSAAMNYLERQGRLFTLEERVTSVDTVSITYHPGWVEGTRFVFKHNGVKIDESRTRELVG